MRPIKLLLLTMISLLILSTVFLLTLQPVKGQTGITINSDGSITPNDGRITTTDQTTYTFTTDITDTIEIIERSNIIVNGNGHTLQDPTPGSDTGIYTYGNPSNITIENMTIANFENGIDVDGSFIQVMGNIFTNCSYIAINGYQDDHCTISKNNITEPANENFGIWLENANSTVISNNTITGGRWEPNTAYGTYAIEVDYPVINDQICGNSLTGGSHGIWIFGSDTYSAAYLDSNNQIFNNTIVDFTEGMTVTGVDTVNNYFYNNQIVNSGEYGIEVGSFGENAACNDTFYSNTITGSGTSNIIVGTQGFNTGLYNNFTDNNVTGSPVGIELINDAWGNIINGNYIANNNAALHLEYNASNNVIIGNKVRGNQVAIQIIGDVVPCNYNTIYHNDFVSNTQQVSQDVGDNSLNVWDNGYPSGGNYWTDYTGIDHYQGVAQNIAGVDDIGDTPYTTGMVGTNQDNYPFMTIMYNQTGVGSDFTGAILSVDSVNYTLIQLPVSYMWSPTASHAYAFQSPLIVTPDVKRYAWTNSTGLSSSQSMGSIIVPYHGNITGNYITQYYMTVDATPDGALGASFQVTYKQFGILYTNQLKYATWSDWIDANTTVTVTSPQQYVPSSSGTNGLRYRFDSFNQSISSVYMDYAKLITLLYVPQYSLIVNSQYGTVSNLEWYDNGTTAYASLMAGIVSGGTSVQYVFTNWTGDANGTNYTQSSAINMSDPKNVTANWKTQYQISFAVAPSDSGTTSPSGTNIWIDLGSLSINATPALNNRFSQWSSSTGSITFTNSSSSVTTATVNGPGTITAHFVSIVPSITISPTSVALDVGQSQMFTSNVSGGTNPYSYQWYLDGNAAFNATSATWTYTPSASGPHTVYVNVTDSVSMQATSNTATVTVNSALSVSILPSSVTLNVSQSQLFTPTVSGGTSPYTYQWYLNDAPVSGATGSTWTFTPTSAGSYTVYVNVTDSVGAQAKSNTVAPTIIPEFPSYLIVPLFMMTTLFATFISKRKRNVGS
jgi:hypothetical protein